MSGADRRSRRVAGTGHRHAAGRIHARSRPPCRSTAAPPTSMSAPSPTTRPGASDRLGTGRARAAAAGGGDRPAVPAGRSARPDRVGGHRRIRLRRVSRRPATRSWSRSTSRSSPRCTRWRTSGSRPSSSSRAGSGRAWPATWRRASRPSSTSRRRSTRPRRPRRARRRLPARHLGRLRRPRGRGLRARRLVGVHRRAQRLGRSTDALRSVLARVAASIGPYAGRRHRRRPPADGARRRSPLTSRALLDHLEAVSGADLAGRFRERILTEADVALLAAARRGTRRLR